MEDINIFDNFFPIGDYNKILNWCLNASYYYGETDDTNLNPTGMTCDIKPSEDVYMVIINRISEIFPKLKHSSPYRTSVNCFSPLENPNFHIDSESYGFTFLYYIDTLDWNQNDGGETQFLIDGNIYGVIPIRNRLCQFDSRILHRATSFRNRHRFTVAIKYNLEF